MNYLDTCRAQLPVDEGRRAKSYKDTQGILTGGIGRNLQDVAFTDGEIALMFANDLERADKQARSLFPTFDAMTEDRKSVLVNMAFNLGPRLGGFIRFRDAVAASDWERAASEMLGSLWAKQVGQRAIRLAEMMRKG